MAHGHVPKDLDMKYENLVKGIRFVQIKVYSLSHSFSVTLLLSFISSLLHVLMLVSCYDMIGLAP